MKYFLHSLIVLSQVGLATLSAQAQDTATTAQKETSNKKEISWMTDWKKAKDMAQAQNKPIFLFFTGSDWCPWCQKMDHEILSSQDFIDPLKDKMIFVYVDFPIGKAQDTTLKEQNDQLKNQYKISGFPTAVILDSKGNPLKELYYTDKGPKAFVSSVLEAVAQKKQP